MEIRIMLKRFMRIIIPEKDRILLKVILLDMYSTIVIITELMNIWNITLQALVVSIRAGLLTE
ncbi:MAG TPA: hypothetical protein DCL73_12305 [Treponema sp.]|nr:hypothetical protein [Treponema sp.]